MSRPKKKRSRAEQNVEAAVELAQLVTLDILRRLTDAMRDHRLARKRKKGRR